jgi:O-antigen ligase
MKALLLLAIALCAAIPSRFVAAALPLVWVLQRLLPPELSVLIKAGPVELVSSDLLILVLFARLMVTVFVERELVADRPLYLTLGAYLVVNLLSTLVAGIKFGEPQLVRCAISWGRFLSELLVLPIIAQAVRTLPQARMFGRVVLVTLVGLAVIQFVNYFGASRGFIIGEVQGIERGEERYFGPIGDSVGVILLLGYLVSLCCASLAGAALFLGGILLTAGLGAMLAAGVGTGCFLLIGLRGKAVVDFARRMFWVLPLLAFTIVVAVVVFAGPLTRTLFDRLGTGNYTTSGAQRAVSAKLAVAMIVDNPLLGVGYMGYERALSHYGGDRYFDLNRPNGATANANNQFLQSLSDSGIIGLAALAAFVFAAGRLLLRLATQCDDPFFSTFFLAAFLWLCAQVFGNLAAVWLNPSSFVARFLWVILGMAVAVARILAASGSRPALVEAEPEKLSLVNA